MKTSQFRSLLRQFHTPSIPKPNYIYPHGSSPHLTTILSYPSKPSLSLKLYKAACSEIISLAATISAFEPVRLYTRPEDIASARSMIASQLQESSLSRVTLIPFPTNHLWVRDTGPVYVHGPDNRRYAIDFGFNEWGMSTYPEEDEDWPPMTPTQIAENNSFAQRVISSDTNPSPVTLLSSKIHLEGGALIVDGQGTLLATESSIINDNRNPGLTKTEIENELRHLLGVQKIIWFPGRKGLDVTDVHVDAEVQFIRPGAVVLSRPNRSASGEWVDVYEEIRDILEKETDAMGRKFEVHFLDEPDPACLGGEVDAATNYVNFYFVNGGLILPRFDHDAADKKALETVKALCPDRAVRQVLVRALPFSGGVLHCATQPVWPPGRI